VIRYLEITETDYPKPGSLHLAFHVEPGEGIPLEFQLWISELVGMHINTNELVFQVPSTLFMSRIDDFRLLKKRFGDFNLKYDSHFEKLVFDFSKDLEKLASAKSDIDLRLSPDEVESDLRKAGFLRWSSQSSDQLRDIGRLAILTNGANFSVPGSGKTNSLLAIHAMTGLEFPNLKLLVACPKNAMLAWDEEVAECFGEDKQIVRLEGSRGQISRLLSKAPQFAMISYQKLKNSTTELISFMRTNNVHLVLDESHRIKAGNRSQQGAAALQLADFAVRRDILSGTPMPQGVSDLEAQFKFLWPNQDMFRSISSESEPAVQIKQANENIRPYFVRTTKRELGLAKPTIKFHDIAMSKYQADTYKLLKNETARYIARLNPEDKAEFRAIGKQIMRILQFCSDPKLLLSRLPQSSKNGELFQRLEILSSTPSNKVLRLDRLVARTMQMPGEKVVVWSMFVDQIEWLVKRYSKYGSTSIHGGVPTGPDDDMAFREARIKYFKASEDCRVLVANPSACGEGISLHKEAHHAIYFDRSFNAAHFLQSIDRIHRRGLPAGVQTHVDILCLSGTIEEAVRSRLSDKIRLLEELLDDEDLSAMVFDPEDVEEYHEDELISPSDFAAVIKVLSD
jgi:SNF2 family DNA or RNA helicase